MEELRQIYRKRKQQLLPLIFGFAAFFIFVRVVLPQWTDIVDAQQLITTKQSTVEAKEATLTLLNSMPSETIDSDYQLITTALPVQKNIVLIYDQLNTVASRANVGLGGFSVKLGGVYSATAASAPEKGGASGIPFLNIVVTVTGQNENVRLFAEELYKSMPLVEITSIDIARSDARYDVKFFYKPIVARPKNIYTTPLTSLNPAEQKQLDELKQWQNGQ